MITGGWSLTALGLHVNINLEACMSIKSVKYLFKYVYKGHDSASLDARQQNTNRHDEVTTYLDTRYVNAPEASWRLSEYKMHDSSHTVQRLPVHLPLDNMVHFNPDDIESAIEGGEYAKLTCWFNLNREHPEARGYFVYKSKQITDENGEPKIIHEWAPRRRHDPLVTRMYLVYPRDRETFFYECYYCMCVVLRVLKISEHSREHYTRRFMSMPGAKSAYR